MTKLNEYESICDKVYVTCPVNVNVKKLVDHAMLPKFANEYAAGADLFASESIVIEPNATKLVKTGISLEIPTGYEGQVRCRSGLALKKQISLGNGVGTIDSDYRGELGIIIHNHGSEKFVVEVGDKIAQILIKKIEQVNFSFVQDLSNTQRGAGGYGSTGTK